MRSFALQSSRLYRRNPEATELGFLLALLVATTLWQSVVIRAYGLLLAVVPVGPDVAFAFGAFLAYVLGAGVAAVAYARARGVEIPFGLPVRGGLSGVALAALAPPALVAAVVLAGDVTGVTAGSMTQSSYGAVVPLPFLVQTVVAPAVLAAAGTALVFHGAVQGTLRELVAPDHAAALTTLVAALFFLFDAPSVRDPATLFVLFLGGTTLVAVGYGVGLLYRGASRGSVRGAFATRGGVALAAVATLGLLTLLSDVDGLSNAAHLCLRVAVVGVGAHAYERTRSVWVPMLAVAAFRVSLGLAVYVESVPGGVGL